MKQNNPKFLKEIKHNQELFKAIKKKEKRKNGSKTGANSTPNKELAYATNVMN